MKSIEYYEKQLQKELNLIEKHKKNATDLRKEIDNLKGKQTVAAVNALNLNGAEYDRFMQLLKQDKKSVIEAIDLVMGTENVQAGKGAVNEKME